MLLVAQVPAGLTAMQALDREGGVSETSYGGRFVVAGRRPGRARAQRDWFYFVDGIPPSRSAAEVRLHDGDVLWWDYRSWREANKLAGRSSAPSRNRFCAVPPSSSAAQVQSPLRLARLVHGRVATSAPRDAYVLELRPGAGFRALDAHRFVIDPRLAARLAEDPDAFRFRFEVAP